MSNETFIEHATKDLTLAKIAFENKFYSQSIFLLQQANEKLAKEMLLKGDIFNMDELRKSSHDTFKPFIKFIKDELIAKNKSCVRIEEKTGIKKEQFISQNFTLREIEFENLITNAEYQKNLDWASITDEELHKLLTEFELLKEIKFEEEISLEFIQKIPEHIETVLPGFFAMVKERQILFDLIRNEDSAKFLRDALNCIIKFALKAINYFSVNIQLSLILYPHNNESRYPSKVIRDCYIYNLKHPIVKNFELIHNLISSSINGYSESIIMLESFRDFTLINFKEKTPA